MHILCISPPLATRFFTFTLILLSKRRLERVKGIEPSSQPWEGHILPLNHTRLLFGALVHTECNKFYQTAP